MHRVATAILWLACCGCASCADARRDGVRRCQRQWRGRTAASPASRAWRYRTGANWRAPMRKAVTRCRCRPARRSSWSSRRAGVRRRRRRPAGFLATAAGRTGVETRIWRNCCRRVAGARGLPAAAMAREGRRPRRAGVRRPAAEIADRRRLLPPRHRRAAASASTHATLGLSLGDIVDDDLSLYPAVNAVTASLGVPWLHVAGNHDIDLDARDDADALQTFRRHFGPDTFAWEEARATFVMLDDVIHQPGDKPAYIGGFRDDQFAFLEAYLPTVPKDRLLVLGMHIPLFEPAGRGHLPRCRSRAPVRAAARLPARAGAERAQPHPAALVPRCRHRLAWRRSRCTNTTSAPTAARSGRA